MVRLTPNGLSVRPRQRAISLVRSSGVGWVSAVMKPSAPALATAATSSARPTHCMPPWTIGCSTPTSSVNRVFNMSALCFPGARHGAPVFCKAFRQTGWRSPAKMSTGRAAGQSLRLCNSGGFVFRRTDIVLIQAGDLGPLRHQREHGVEGRGWNAGQPAHFLNHADQRIDLHRAVAFEILQHRGLVGADLAGALDAPFDIDAELDAEGFGDRLRLQHDRLRQRACRGRRADHVEGCMRQRADRVEADIAPQLEPDLVADAIQHGSLHAGRREQFGEPPDVLAGLAGGFAERELITIDMLDDTGG